MICSLQMERRRNLQPARSPVAFGRGHRYVLSAAPAATHRRDYLSSHKSAGEIEASPYKAGHLLFLLLYSIPKGRRRRRRNITLWTSQSTCKFTCKSNSKSAEIWREREKKMVCSRCIRFDSPWPIVKWTDAGLSFLRPKKNVYETLPCRAIFKQDSPLADLQFDTSAQLNRWLH